MAPRSSPPTGLPFSKLPSSSSTSSEIDTPRSNCPSLLALLLFLTGGVVVFGTIIVTVVCCHNHLKGVNSAHADDVPVIDDVNAAALLNAAALSPTGSRARPRGLLRRSAAATELCG